MYALQAQFTRITPDALLAKSSVGVNREITC